MLNRKIINALQIAANYSRQHAQDYLMGKRVHVSITRPSRDETQVESGKYLEMLPAFKKMSKRQKLFFKAISRPYDRTRYLNTFLGKYASVKVLRPFLESTKKLKSFDELRDNAGKFLKLQSAMIDANASHKPTDGKYLGNMVGIEIECLIPCDLVSSIDELRKLVETKKLKYTSVKHDGSISYGDLEEEDYFTAEIVVLDRVDSKDNLRKVCELLGDLGATVNKSCGLHVHLDQRDLGQDTRKVSTRATRIGNTLEVLKTLVAPSRLNNTYCKLGVSSYRGSRYFAVNKTAFSKYGTLEIRLHSSTTDFGKISNWIDLIYSISRCKGLSRNKVATLDALWDKVQLSPELKAYFISRQNKFSPQNPNQAQDDAA